MFSVYAFLLPVDPRHRPLSPEQVATPKSALWVDFKICVYCFRVGFASHNHGTELTLMVATAPASFHDGGLEKVKL